MRNTQLKIELLGVSFVGGFSGDVLWHCSVSRAHSDGLP
jgi:hypothetical protein